MRLKATLLILFSLAAASAAAQTRPSPTEEADKDRRSPIIGSPEQEMLRRAEIKAAEESHKEMVERAEEAAQLGDQIRASYEKLKSLGRDDLKKLERLEKLARKIRGAVGGSDDKEPPKESSSKLGSAVSRIAEVAGLLKKSVQKTSRLVISAAIIEQTNELIDLIQDLRQKTTP
jgi:type I site-specific restriction endonuclease